MCDEINVCVETARGVVFAARSCLGQSYGAVGKVSTDRQSKKFSSTDDRFLWTVGICALNSLSTAGTEKDPISTEILD